MKKLIYCVCFILYFILWTIAFFIYAIRYDGFSIFKAAYGPSLFLTGLIVSILIMSSIIYLRIFIKNKLFVYFVSYVITIIFLTTILLLGDLGINKFSKFTTENWVNHPMQRMLMYTDLESNYNIIGYSVEDLEMLLGKPEYVDSSNTYLYESGRFLIFVEFADGKVTKMYYRN